MAASVVPGRPKYLGFVVALVGFALTRFIVLESVRGGVMTAGFLVGDGPFLVVGLAVTAFGVALVVSDYSHHDVAVVAAWCLLGTGAAGLLVASAVVEARLGGAGLSMSGERLLPRVLIGGTAVGVVLGLRSAATGRQSRRLSAQADRLTLLNRILRHEVLNRVNVIRGYASLDPESVPRSQLDTIEHSAQDIEAAIEEVGVLTRTSEAKTATDRVDLVATLRREVETARETYPEAQFDVDLPADAAVRATDTLGLAFGHLLENAVVHNEGRATVTVDAAVDGDAVRVRIADDGPGLPEEQRRMLAAGSLPEFDDPRAGFGLTIARVLVEQSDGSIEATATDGGTELTVTLHRSNGHAPAAAGVERDALVDVTLAALVAGGAMGLVLQSLTGNIAIVGALYGVANAGVGWVTHQFHSVVFGVGFVAALSGRRLRRYHDSPLAVTGVGVGYGVLLWFVASGFVMPVWLNAVGIPASVPTLGATNLFGHVVWGAVLGGGFVAASRRRE